MTHPPPPPLPIPLQIRLRFGDVMLKKRTSAEASNDEPGNMKLGRKEISKLQALLLAGIFILNRFLIR